MSEQKPFDTENKAAEEIREETLPAAENAPKEEIKAEKTSKPKSKKRKKAKINLQFAAILLVIALLFGMVVGFAIGRINTRNNLIEAEIEIAALNERIAELEGSWADADGLTDENIDALNLLSGEDDDEYSFLGDDEALLGYEEAPAEDIIVAEFKGGSLLSGEVASAYNDQVAGYIFSGFTEEDIPESLLDELLEEMAGQKVLMAKAQEMGVYALTEADKAEIAAEAEATMNEMISIFRSYVDTAGKDEAAITEEVRAYLAEYEGISYDSIYAMLSESWWMDKLYDEIVKDVKIESTDIIELYNEKMENQKAAFTEYPDDFEATQMGGETIVYNLEGYRAVRLLSISPDEPGAAETAAIIEEELALLDPEKDSRTIGLYQEELDQLYASTEAAMLSVKQQIASGAKFTDMLAKYGEDIGMQMDELKDTGYYVSKDSLLWPKQMVDAAFALANPGDISEPFRMNGSVCIVEYVGDVTPGEISIDVMYDAISREALEYARAEAYDSQIEKWMNEADIKYYPERMR